MNLKSKRMVEEPTSIYSVSGNTPLFVIYFGVVDTGEQFFRTVYSVADFITSCGGFFFGFTSIIMSFNIFINQIRVKTKLINIATKTQIEEYPEN